MITLDTLCGAFMTPARRSALDRALVSPGRVGAVTGLAGSSPAMMLAAMTPQGDGPVIVVGDSLDDAGYLYHDLSLIHISEPTRP